MGSSSRSTIPPPLAIATTDSGPSSPVSMSSLKGKESSRSFSSEFARPSFHHSASRSSSSTGSTCSRKPVSPTVNVYTHCGRHTDQFLFGGRSMTDLVRGLLRRDSN